MKIISDPDDNHCKPLEEKIGLRKIEHMLNISDHLTIAISFRLGYLAAPVRYLRVRRDLNDFAHHNNFENKGLKKN